MTRRFAVSSILAGTAYAQRQNPSPMVDTTRRHERMKQSPPQGSRTALSLGQLFTPEKARSGLVVHFHGGSWLPEQAVHAYDRRLRVLSLQLGAGSAVYAKPFSDPAVFPRLMEEARAAGPVVLTGFSAGYGAIREILRYHVTRVDGVILMDGLHAAYVPEGVPGPLNTEPLQPFAAFAREAAAGPKRMLVTHSEIFPGTFASTTETADWLLAELGLRRKPVLRWGPLGMQQLSEVRRGRFAMKGFAGNTAPDHVDHLHAMKFWLEDLPK